MGSKSTTVNTLNLKIARRLDEVAQVLSEQGANPYRVQAYRNAATNLRRLLRPVDVILKQAGEPGLRKLPGIGQSLARAQRQISKSRSKYPLDQWSKRPLQSSASSISEPFGRRLGNLDLGMKTKHP